MKLKTELRNVEPAAHIFVYDETINMSDAL